ncbi:putative PPM-type phosphatase domain, protein phosphatase 2C family [Helianthus anomalus]
MSRAFGDFCLKDYGLISVQNVYYPKLTDQHEFVVLATYGVWDVLKNDEVVKIVGSMNNRSMAARSVVDHAVKA